MTQCRLVDAAGRVEDCQVVADVAICSLCVFCVGDVWFCSLRGDLEKACQASDKDNMLMLRSSHLKRGIHVTGVAQILETHGHARGYQALRDNPSAQWS